MALLMSEVANDEDAELVVEEVEVTDSEGEDDDTQEEANEQDEEQEDEDDDEEDDIEEVTTTTPPFPATPSPIIFDLIATFTARWKTWRATEWTPKATRWRSG